MGKLLQRFATPLTHQLEGREVWTVVFVAISFQTVFTGYRSIQNLQSSLNEENGVGVISLGVLYGAWIFSGVLTPTVLRFLTTKGALMVAWVCHILYMAASFYPNWELIVPSSLLVGAFSAPLWTAQSLYITACGYSQAKRATGSPYHIFSRLNGIFFAIYETSQITGNLISSLVLRNGVNNRSTEIVFEKCGRGDCPAADNATDFEEPQAWVIDVLLGVFISLSLVGLLVTYFFVMPLPKGDWAIVASTKETVTSFFVTLRRTWIGLLVPLFIFQGMQQAVLYSEFTRSYISCPVGIHMVGFVMAAHGATTPFATWLFSRLVKFTGRCVLFLLAGSINLCLMVVMYLWTPTDSHLPFIFLMPIAWGVSEGIWMTQCSSLIAVKFHDHKESAFAIYHTSRSIGLALTFAYSSLLCAWIKLAVAMAFVLVGLLFYIVAEIWCSWKERSDQHGRGVQHGSPAPAASRGIHASSASMHDAAARAGIVLNPIVLQLIQSSVYRSSQNGGSCSRHGLDNAALTPDSDSSSVIGSSPGTHDARITSTSSSSSSFLSALKARGWLGVDNNGGGGDGGGGDGGFSGGDDVFMTSLPESSTRRRSGGDSDSEVCVF